MRPLTGELLIDAWQQAASENGLARPLTLLAAAGAGRSWDELADLSIAERDLELLRLRQLTFGDRLRGCLPCGGCAARVEFEISVSTMLDRLDALRPPATTASRAGDHAFSMRPVTSRDFDAIASASDPRRSLLARCTAIESPDAAAAFSSCEQLLVDQFNQLNEGAETCLSLPCPACGSLDRADLDIARFLWLEIRHAAITLLREVHELASAYGWSEAAILAMSSARRAVYLELART